METKCPDYLQGIVCRWLFLARMSQAFEHAGEQSSILEEKTGAKHGPRQTGLKGIDKSRLESLC
jgi:hypothetical protein